MKHEEYDSSSLYYVSMAIAAMNDKNIEQWHHSRFIAFISTAPYRTEESNITIYEWLPLPGDPTKEQQQKMKEAAAAHEYDKMKGMMDEGRELVRQMQAAAAGLIKN